MTIKKSPRGRVRDDKIYQVTATSRHSELEIPKKSYVKSDALNDSARLPLKGLENSHRLKKSMLFVHHSMHEQHGARPDGIVRSRSMSRTLVE
ncbi:hypothetical protein [Burkholderia dolosa]|uniref:hypothetical protein n=1 Tax=Burkholderia dolosa TaxID=152500 RepID=UPI00158FFDDD|nr:hypothetical protein [Burkholderia dolosa]